MPRSPKPLVLLVGAALLIPPGSLVPGMSPEGERITMSDSKKSPFADLHEEAAMPYDPDAGGPGSSAAEGVRRRHEAALLALPGVTGVALGRSPIGDDAIVVYLRDASARGRVPAQIEGYPVQTTVTGEIDAY